MKQFATNRLYLNGSDHITPCIIEVDEQGTYLAHRPLIEEMSNVIWKGGAVILAPSKPRLTSCETTIASLCSDLLICTQESDVKIYCWHISSVDFEKHCTTANSRITLLK